MIVNRLSRLLAERRLSVAEFAVLAGMDYGTPYKFWTGKHRRFDIGTLDKLCKALNVGVGDLLEYVPDAPES